MKRSRFNPTVLGLSVRASKGLLAVLAGGLLFWFQNCGSQTGYSVHSSQGTLPSAFSKQKVQIQNESFETSSAETSAHLKVDTPLIVKVNNACARTWCETPENADTITCQAYAQKPHPKLQDSFQVYTLPSPGTLSPEELEQWVNKSPVDQACVKGISEQRTYNLRDMAFNDPLYVNQKPYMDLVAFEAGQTYFPAGSLDNVKVGVIDCGVGTHPDLDANVIERNSMTVSTVASGSPYPLFAADNPTLPNCYHGTFVAGIIAAVQNNSDKMVGVAPNAKIYSYGIGNSQGRMTSMEIANAVQAAVNDRLDVINMSLGDTNGTYNDDPMVRDGLIDGYNNNIFFVVAAGNSHQLLDQAPAYPAQYAATLQNVMAVGAANVDGSIASFSNYSPNIVNIVAPGKGIYSLTPPHLGNMLSGSGGYGISDGTSFAAPMVTGAAALVIGLQRHNGLVLDFGRLRNLISVSGARHATELASYAIDGSFLNFVALGQAVQNLSDQAPLSVTQVRGVDANGKPTVQLTLTWNSSMTGSIAPNSNLGIFDMSPGCNFSKACLITTVSWPPTSAICDGTGACTYSKTLSRNEVLSVSAAKTDPSMALPLVAAVYHVVYNPTTGKPKNNYGVDLSASVNLRGLDAGLGQPLQGAVLNIRTDMQYMYVQGWACLPGSEAAVPVQLVPSGEPALTTGYAYIYPLMVPHSSLDGAGDTGSWMTNVGPNHQFTGWPHSRPYMAYNISVGQTGRSVYLAGLEGNPTLVEPCNTLTASHGFEFVVPLEDAAGFMGSTFRIVAGTSPQLVLADPSGAVDFDFPNSAAAAVQSSSIAFQRDTQNYRFSGNICSTSPSPIEVEVSYTSYNFVYAMTLKAPYGTLPPAGFVSDTALVATAAAPLPVETVEAKPSDMSLKFTAGTLDPAGFSPFLTAYQSYSQFRPNAAVYGPGGRSPAELATFESNVNAHSSFVQVGTGAAVDYHQEENALNAGSELSSQASAAIQSMAGMGFATNFNLIRWDLYDVGEPFSTTLVGYDLSTHFPAVAQYIQNSYQVTTVLREIKKFETPLALNTAIIGHGNLSIDWNGSCSGGGFEHDLAALTIANYVNLSESYLSGAEGFWLRGQSPALPSTATVQTAMQRLPVTLRFFQDGKLILHLESDTGTNLNRIDYSFH